MGVHSLILIGRQTDITLQANRAAASGQEGLQNRREYKSWDEFMAEESSGVYLAFSARDGQTRPLWDMGSVLNWLKNEHENFSEVQHLNLSTRQDPVHIYLIFGPEDAGLSNEDLDLVHFNLNIPTFGENSSLNLSHAVLLALYTLRLHWGGGREKPHEMSGSSKLGSRKFRSIQRTETAHFPEKTLWQWLEAMKFDLSKEVNAYSVFKRMLLHNVPTEKELNILHIVLNQSIRKMREYNEMRTLLLAKGEKTSKI